MMMASRGLRNNNPLNIRRSSESFKGEIIGTDASFKTFLSMGHGYRAAMKILQGYQKNYGLKTIRTIISRWAPPSENDTPSYIATVSRVSGIGADKVVDLMKQNDMTRIVAGMSQVENGTAANMDDISQGWELLNKL